jgi:hypothetical protein
VPPQLRHLHLALLGHPLPVRLIIPLRYRMPDGKTVFLVDSARFGCLLGRLTS